jgi:hypothetical protein
LVPIQQVRSRNQAASGIADAIRDFESLETKFNPHECRRNALRFPPQVFRDTYARFVQCCWSNDGAPGIDATPLDEPADPALGRASRNAALAQGTGSSSGQL